MRREVRSRMSDCVKVRCATKRDVIGEVSMQATCPYGESGLGGTRPHLQKNMQLPILAVD